jgi:tetratricopeptide (TPR) repeat protein
MGQGFFGREDELASLMSLFKAAATRGPDGRYGGPRMAFVLAESGVGKSRLVQELYIRLTEDPAWDPPETDYWPPAFGDGGVNLAVIPSMKGHVPKGPPRFAWLGARWQSPDERNALERRSVLPDLRSSVTVHAEVLRSHGSAWSDAVARAVATARQEATGVVIDVVGIPFFGLLSTVATNIKDFTAERLAGPKRFEDLEADEVDSEVDEVLGCMRLLLEGKGALPAVLWLDDAQWIDAESLEFVRRLWAEAERRGWPLFMVVTHWEREWRELKHEARERLVAGNLVDFEGRPGVSLLHLANADAAPLDAYLASRLPGLTAAQRRMLVDKAGGNFLTMVENVGELLRHPANFIDRDLAAALSRAGEGKVAKWESVREKRVEQRFGELEPEVQDLLGWSSQLGLRFLREVVEEFAQRAAELRAPGALIERCVDPYVILGKPGEHTREFRDSAFHAVASRHFAEYGEEHREALSATLREHLVRWINDSFDASGSEIWPSAAKGIAPPERSATALAQDERRDLLGMAMRELPLPAEPDWTDPQDVAAFRAVYLAVITEYRERLWSKVRTLCRLFETVDFEALPPAVLSPRDRSWLCDTAFDSGARATAERIAQAELAARRRASSGSEDAEVLRGFSVDLIRAGNILAQRGETLSALALFEEDLSISRRLVQQDATPEHLRDLTVSLNKVGDILAQRGEPLRALHLHEESQAISRRLVQQDETPERLRDLSVSLHKFGDILTQRGEPLRALEAYEEGLAIARRLAREEETTEHLRDLSVSLCGVANLLAQRGEALRALELCEEDLAIARRLLQQDETPQHMRDLAVSLNKVGNIFAQRGEPLRALESYEESLAIARRLVEEDETPVHLRDLSVSLVNVGDILARRGEPLRALELYEEDLVIARRLVQQDETPGHLRDLAVSLSKVGNILAQRDEPLRALPFFEESLSIARRLVQDDETPEHLRHLSVSLSKVGDIFARRGEPLRALELYEEDLAIARRLVQDDDIPAHLRDLGVSLNKVGGMLEELGEPLRAFERYEDGLSIARRVVQQDETPEHLRDLSVSLSRVADMLAQRGELSQALELHEEDLAIARRLVQDDRTPRHLNDLVLSLSKVGEILLQQDELHRALALYEEGLTIARLLAQDEGTPPARGRLHHCLFKVGDICRSLGRHEAAFERRRENLDLYRSEMDGIDEADQGPDAVNQVVWCLHLASESLLEMHRADEASALLADGLSLAERLAGACGDDENLLDTCAAYWESTAKAAEALWDAAQAADAAARGAEFRRRLAGAA